MKSGHGGKENVYSYDSMGARKNACPSPSFASWLQWHEFSAQTEENIKTKDTS